MESELRNSLLAAVSHDLRTPLTSLVGMTDTLMRQQAALPPDVHDTLRAMRDQAQRMHALVANLLDMARLQSRDTPLRLEWQSIEELVGAALADLREPLAAHRVTVDSLSDLPLVECDGVLIERVLCNLLENAAKYTPAGSSLRLSAAVQDGELRVAVADDGPGVEPGAERRIFEKFTRGDRESATPGVGLGLAVCEAIVSAHRGRIWVEQAPGQESGAQFVFTLPLGTPPPIQPDPVTAHRMFDYQPTVLIIEDDANIRRFVRHALESEGCAVHEADTVKRGLIEAGTRQPDAVVLDLGLPDEDGMTLIRELRGWTEVPVLVLSARTAESDKVAALDAGADDYLPKPFGVSELLARLRVLLRRHARGGAETPRRFRSATCAWTSPGAWSSAAASTCT